MTWMFFLFQDGKMVVVHNEPHFENKCLDQSNNCFDLGKPKIRFRFIYDLLTSKSNENKRYVIQLQQNR